MPTIPFGEYRPDVNELDGEHSRSILNVLPQGDGYGPVRGLVALTTALPARCRGYFCARSADGVVIFAGTETELYQLDNTTFAWTKVSRGGGPYAALDSTAHWQFAQFNDFVFATQRNEPVQVFDTTGGSAFANLGGSPPQAAYIAVVGRFVMLTGLLSSPYRIQWSGLNETDNWTAGTNSSDFQDAPDGGVTRQVLGGEVGFLFQDTAIRRLFFSPGSDVVFVIEKVGKDIGLLHPYAACAAGDKFLFLSAKGFMMGDASGGLTPVGAEKVDRTFIRDYDSSAPQFVLAGADPKNKSFIITYRSEGQAADAFDMALIYNWLLQRWTPIAISGECLAELSAPGLTIEGLDALAPGALAVTGAANNGGGLIRITVASTSTLVDGDYYTLSSVGGVPNANGTFAIDVINGTTFDLLASTWGGLYTSGGIVGGFADLMDISWDALSVSTLPNIAFAGTDHALGFLSGDNTEAILETPEQSGDGKRLLVQGFWPVTDADDVRGCVSKRDNLNTALTYTNESTMNDDGFVPQLRSTRYSRGKVRMPAAVDWTFATGIRPEFTADGER